MTGRVITHAGEVHFVHRATPPDISNKALITTAAPAVKKMPSRELDTAEA